MIEIIGGSAVAYIIYSVSIGLLPGIVLRPLLWLYPKGSDRPEEILGELYALPLMKRLPWAFWQAEVVLFEGGRERVRSIRLHRKRRRVLDGRTSSTPTWVKIGQLDDRTAEKLLALPLHDARRRIAGELLAQEAARAERYARHVPASGIVPTITWEQINEAFRDAGYH